jgi:asparagine synthase (glutamine-hydrolysing)
MCGLTGFLNASRNQTLDDMLAVVNRMAGTLQHRGPDDTGTWCDPANGIALGFKRLSIVDLSAAGHQPMVSSCGRFVIAYNGEIYNHDDLRSELATSGRSFRGHSDTEMLIEGFAVWGIEPTIQRCIGMFAFAVWDTQRRELTFGRDRLGKKPLYFWRSGSTLLFGSETKALRAHPDFVAKINRKSIGEFLKHSYLPTSSIYQEVHPVLPGSLMVIKLDDPEYWSSQQFPAMKRYWSFRPMINRGNFIPFHGTYEQAVDQLDELLTDAVGRRMVADVPLGAFLSGGIDSSLVVALMQKQSSRPVKTFTIGFDEEAYNEAPFAKRVAEHLRTDHTELYVTSKEARDVIPLLPKLFDEPFADSSQIPTYLVSQLARQHVTVALSGDGGDELFCGYRRYFEALEGFFPAESGNKTVRGSMSRLAAFSRQVPSPLRHVLAWLSKIGGRLPLGRLSRQFSVAAEVLSDYGPHYRYLRNLSHWQHEDAAGLGVPISDTRLEALDLCRWLDDPQEKPGQYQQIWQAYDTLNYLPGDILTKVDRASMGISLEARTPLLDHRVVEFAWSLPHEFKAQNGFGKRILRDVLARYVPRELFERPKIGFGVPIDAWLRGPLREWAEELLDEHRLKREGFLNPAPIRRKWSEHLKGQTDWHYHLWDVLMFEAWLAEYPVA